MKIEDIGTIAVIGAGDMGHGIAEVALLAGYRVFLRDVTSEYLNRGVSRIRQSLEKLVSKGKVSSELQDKINKELLIPCTELDQAVAEADLVIEAIPEIMELKKETFAAMDKAAPEHTIFASNTSTMSISEIAAITNRPDRVMGMHYFNPAVLMKLVEVIRGKETAEETLQLGYDYVIKAGKVPVRVQKDVPGFIVNRVQAPSSVLLSAILDQGEMTPESVDAVMRGLGFPMGPYETMDFAGLDILVHGSDYYAETIHPDFRMGRVIMEKFKAKEFGKKSGRGLFDWSSGRPQVDPSQKTDKFDPMDLLAVNANEAAKIVEQEVCTLADVDTAIINGTGNPMGLIAMIQGIEPKDLTSRLEKLAAQYQKEIFKPARMIREGNYR